MKNNTESFPKCIFHAGACTKVTLIFMCGSFVASFLKSDLQFGLVCSDVNMNVYWTSFYHQSFVLFLMNVLLKPEVCQSWRQTQYTLWVSAIHFLM